MRFVYVILGQRRKKNVESLLDGVAYAEVRNVVDIIGAWFQGRQREHLVISDGYGWLGLKALFLGWILRAPVLFRVRGDVFRERPEALRDAVVLRRLYKLRMSMLVVRYCLRHASMLLVNSCYIRKRFEEAGVTTPQVVIRNPCYDVPTGIGTFDPISLPDGGLHICSISSMAHLSKIDALIEAVTEWVPRELWEEWDLYWVVCGRGKHFDHFKRRVEEAGLESRVLLLGWQSDLEAVWQWTDVFAHFTRLDAFPNVTMEAMVREKPVITNPDSCGTREQVVDGATGFVVDQTTLVNRLARYREEPALRQEHGKAGAAYAREHFSVEVQARRLREVLEQF